MFEQIISGAVEVGEEADRVEYCKGNMVLSHCLVF